MCTPGQARPACLETCCVIIFLWMVKTTFYYVPCASLLYDCRRLFSLSRQDAFDKFPQGFLKLLELDVGGDSPSSRCGYPRRAAVCRYLKTFYSHPLNFFRFSAILKVILFPLFPLQASLKKKKCLLLLQNVVELFVLLLDFKDDIALEKYEVGVSSQWICFFCSIINNHRDSFFVHDVIM